MLPRKEVAVQMPSEWGRVCHTERSWKNSRDLAVEEDKKPARARSVPVLCSMAEQSTERSTAQRLKEPALQAMCPVFVEGPKGKTRVHSRNTHNASDEAHCSFT